MSASASELAAAAGVDVSFITDRVAVCSAKGSPPGPLRGFLRSLRKPARVWVVGGGGDKWSAEDTVASGDVMLADWGEYFVPKVGELLALCADIEKWLETAGDDSIAVFQCQTGKGRSGLVVCAFLMYLGAYSSYLESLQFFSNMRKAASDSSKFLVRQPSQHRILKYVEHIAVKRLRRKLRKRKLGDKRMSSKLLGGKLYYLSISKFKLHYIGSGSSTLGSKFILELRSALGTNKYELTEKSEGLELKLSGAISVAGDVFIQVYKKKSAFRVASSSREKSVAATAVAKKKILFGSYFHVELLAEELSHLSVDKRSRIVFAKDELDSFASSSLFSESKDIKLELDLDWKHSEPLFDDDEPSSDRSSTPAEIVKEWLEDVEIGEMDRAFIGDESTGPSLRREGLLLKLGANVKSWKERFFRREGPRLKYFTDSTDPKPKGIIELEDCIVRRAPDERYKHSYTFEIFSLPSTSATAPARTYALTAASESERLEWMESIGETAKLVVLSLPSDVSEYLIPEEFSPNRRPGKPKLPEMDGIIWRYNQKEDTWQRAYANLRNGIFIFSCNFESFKDLVEIPLSETLFEIDDDKSFRFSLNRVSYHSKEIFKVDSERSAVLWKKAFRRWCVVENEESGDDEEEAEEFVGSVLPTYSSGGGFLAEPVESSSAPSAFSHFAPLGTSPAKAPSAFAPLPATGSPRGSPKPSPKASPKGSPGTLGTAAPLKPFAHPPLTGSPEKIAGDPKSIAEKTPAPPTFVKQASVPLSAGIAIPIIPGIPGPKAPPRPEAKEDKGSAIPGPAPPPRSEAKEEKEAFIPGPVPPPRPESKEEKAAAYPPFVKKTLVTSISGQAVPIKPLMPGPKPPPRPKDVEKLEKEDFTEALIEAKRESTRLTISSAFTKEIIMSGFLVKRGLSFTSWKLRYFVLRKTGSFAYFKSSQDFIPIAEFGLADSRVAEVSKDKYKKDHCFELYVSDEDRLHILVAESAEERAKWIKVLEVAIARATRLAHQSPFF